MKEKPPSDYTFELEPRYYCQDCEILLEEGERRCDSCNKFASRVDVILFCPHCEQAITTEDV